MAISSTILQGFGLILLTKLTYNISTFLYLYLRPSSLHRYKLPSNQSWALVTGASDGIGQGFAEALCSKGFNVLLHGRNPTKLSTVKASLLSKYPGIQIQTVIADAFDPSADVEAIVTVAENLPGKLKILINNVGGAPLSPTYGALSELDGTYVDNIMNLNARFPTQLTRVLLPLLSRNTPALIMNICSITGLRGLPYLIPYSASKSFDYTFSQALSTELLAQNTDIEVLGIVVGNVISGGNKTDYKGFTCGSLEMAESALGRVGCGKSCVFGWWRHGVQWWLMGLAPGGFVERKLIEEIRERKALDEKVV